MIKVYTTNPPCPKCKVLKKKLDEISVEYTVISDTKELLEAADKANTDFAPILCVNDEYMDLTKAEEWIKENK